MSRHATAAMATSVPSKRAPPDHQASKPVHREPTDPPCALLRTLVNHQQAARLPPSREAALEAPPGTSRQPRQRLPCLAHGQSVRSVGRFCRETAAWRNIRASERGRFRTSPPPALSRAPAFAECARNLLRASGASRRTRTVRHHTLAAAFRGIAISCLLTAEGPPNTAWRLYGRRGGAPRLRVFGPSSESRLAARRVTVLGQVALAHAAAEQPLLSLRYLVPDRYQVVNTLPLNGSGKLDRAPAGQRKNFLTRSSPSASASISSRVV